jgi:hypothetical protein
MTSKPSSINLPLEALGVGDHQFTHPSKIHGAGHVNRVIYYALALARSMGYNDILPEVWAAAYLHDLARRHDGVCPYHGAWAIDEHLFKYWPTFIEAGVQDIEAVKQAVIVHSLPEERPGNRVCQVLKDADALDRVRLGDLDPRYFRLERTPVFMQFAERLFRETHDQTDWMTIWNKAVQVFNPHLGKAKSVPMPWNDRESGRERMMRRLNAAQFPWNKVDVELRRNLPILNDPKRPVISGTPVTYVRPETWQAIQREGRFLSFWELEERGIKAWHEQFNDNPADARAFNEERLFGERCRHMAFGVLFNPKVFGPEPDIRMRLNYGSVRLHLSPSLLEVASFTINDSQMSPYAAPWSQDNALLLTTACQLGLLPLPSRRINYLELQFHTPITVSMVREVA